jgi:hypothetical protein
VDIADYLQTGALSNHMFCCALMSARPSESDSVITGRSDALRLSCIL